MEGLVVIISSRSVVKAGATGAEQGAVCRGPSAEEEPQVTFCFAERQQSHQGKWERLPIRELIVGLRIYKLYTRQGHSTAPDWVPMSRVTTLLRLQFGILCLLCGMDASSEVNSHSF